MTSLTKATYKQLCKIIVYLVCTCSLDQGGGREMEMNLNKLSEIERSDWSRAISSKRDVAYGLALKRLLF